MALIEATEETIETIPSGSLQIKTVTRIVDDTGEVVATKLPHRRVLHPGAAVSGESQRVQDIAAAVWTPEVIRAWEESQAPA